MSKSVKRLLDGKGYEIYAVQPDSSVFDAISLMADKDIGAVLVMDGRRLVGIVSERDYTRRVILRERSSKATTVSEIMTPEVVTTGLTNTVEECMALMTERRIRHLPVKSDDGTVLGVISIMDVVRAVIDVKNHSIDELERYIIGH